MSKWQVVSYRITYMSSSNVAWLAEVRCYGSDDLSGPEVALIRFYPDSTATPPDGWVNDVVNGVPLVNYPISRFNDIVKILREEDYITVTTFSYTSGSSYVKGWGVSTGMQDVGDMIET